MHCCYEDCSWQSPDLTLNPNSTPTCHWRRSLREHDNQVMLVLDPGNWRLFSPSLVLGIYVLHAAPPVGTISKDAALSE